MSYRYVVMLASALFGAVFAVGQAQAQSAPESEATPASIPDVSDGPVSSFFTDFKKGCRAEFSAEAESVLWFLMGSQGRFPIAVSLPGQGPLAEVGDSDRPGLVTSGGRLALGYWVVEENAWVAQGIRDFGGEATFFIVGRRSVDVSTDTPATLFRPFFDLNNRTDSGFLVGAPGIATGSINAHAQTSLWGSEANVWKNVYFDKPGTTISIDLMAGFRYLNAESRLDINSASSFNQNFPAASPFAPFAGNQLQVMDSFSTHNNFYGGQVGIMAKSYYLDGKMSLEGSFRLALGNTSEDLTINGSQLRTFANSATVISNGGLLALPSNIGDHHINAFSQIPEVDIKLAFPIGNHLRLLTGFSTLYWNKILRPAAQIDRSIDITQIPNFPFAGGVAPTGLAHPSVPFNQSDLWVLGINVGVEYRW